MSSKQRYILFVTMVAGFAAPLMSTALNLAITSISSDLNCGATTATWVINAYTLCTAMFSLPFGHLADMYGRRRFIIFGTTLFALSSLLCCLAPNVYILIAARVTMSIGTASFLAGTVPLMLTYFPPDMKGRMLGTAVIATYLGISLGPFFGGIITMYAGWRVIFIPGIAFALASLAVTCLKIESDSHPAVEPFDIAGTLLFMIGIGLFMCGLSEWNNQMFAPVICIAGLVVIIIFVIFESHQEHPVVQVRLFVGNPAYGLSNLACLLSFGASFAVTYTMAIFLQNVFGMTPLLAGTALMSTPIAQVILSPLAGRLADRIAPHKIASAGMMVIVMGLIALSFLSEDFPLWAIIAGLVLIGIGSAFFATPNNAAILSCVDRDHYSEANSTISTMRGVGQSLSIAMVSMVFSLTVGNAVITQVEPHAFTHAIHIVLIVGVCISLVAMLVSLVRNRSTA